MTYAVALHDLNLTRSNSFSLRIPRLQLRRGSIIGVTGPNGSGKTSLLECLTGLTTPNTGHIAVEGYSHNKNLCDINAIVGFIPDDEDWFVKELCAREYFDLLKSIHRKVGIHEASMEQRIVSIAKQLGFTQFEQQLATLSHGNKKKTQIIAGLLHTPKVIIADELRNGLDPLAIAATECLIQEEAKRGACIISATHDLWWAERIAHEIVLLNNGAVVAHQKTRAILKQHNSLADFFALTIGNAHVPAAI